MKILTSETIKNLDAPKVASFSSKGPNDIIPDILKVHTSIVFVCLLIQSTAEYKISSIFCIHACSQT